MALAIFDLDNTLIAGDSDHLWGTFMIDKGVVDATHFAQQNDQFYKDYQQGELDIMAYQKFALAPIANRSMETLAEWHREFMEKYIEPIYLESAQRLVNAHQVRGDRLLIITATNSFITTPIGKRYGIDELIGTTPEIKNNVYTGEVTGTPSFQQGKVERLDSWLADNNESLSGSYFYSDSHNDLPLLEKVDHPVVVDGDDKLIAAAEARSWDCISLRGA